MDREEKSKASLTSQKNFNKVFSNMNACQKSFKRY